MKIIKNANKRDILRKRDAYLKDWQAKSDQYKKEVNEYQSVKDNYTELIKREVIDTIGINLLEPFSSGLEVKVSPSGARFHGTYTNEGEYRISITYTPDNRSSVSYTGTGSKYFKGVPFRVDIFVAERYDGDYERELVSSPTMDDVRDLKPEDYDMLIKEVELFKKLNTIDWPSILTKAKEGPKREDYVKSENPGSADTSMFENELMDAYVNKTLGKDLWLNVFVRRPDSFNPDAENVNEPDVYRDGWMQLIKTSPAYYYFHWIRDGYRYTGGRGYASVVMMGEVSKRSMEYALNETHKVKKAYFELPNRSNGKPLYLTSDEMCIEDEGNS